MRDAVYVSYQWNLFTFGAKDAITADTSIIFFSGLKSKDSAQQVVDTSAETN